VVLRAKRGSWTQEGLNDWTKNGSSLIASWPVSNQGLYSPYLAHKYLDFTNISIECKCCKVPDQPPLWSDLQGLFSKTVYVFLLIPSHFLDSLVKRTRKTCQLSDGLKSRKFATLPPQSPTIIDWLHCMTDSGTQVTPMIISFPLRQSHLEMAPTFAKGI